MKLLMVGCTHRRSSVDVLERLAFTEEQLRDALALFRERFGGAEAVLLSTCNRVELYAAAAEQDCPDHQRLIAFLAEFHGLDPATLSGEFELLAEDDVAQHLFTVIASLDSMVVGEAQIVSQVKRAYELATETDCTGPNLHAAFQAAIHTAKRVAAETAVHQRRVSIPSIAVADFARQIFERFDNKHILLIGAGEMGEETLRYLIDEGARDITLTNRSAERAAALAEKYGGTAQSWDQLERLLVEADLIVTTTGAGKPIVTLHDYRQIERSRQQRRLFVLDLAIPRDFDPAIGDCAAVYLYSIDDLRQACEVNLASRQRHLPKAEKIIEEETARFTAEQHRRATGPAIKRLTDQAGQIKEEELTRLMNKLGDADEHTQAEITRSFDRLVNKLLHPPLESLRDDAQQGGSHGLLAALTRLFKLKD